MKKLIGIITIIAVLSIFSFKVSAKTTAIKYQSTINSVVQIEMMDNDGNFYNGSGVIISVDGIILTAAHVIVDPITKKASEIINICPIKNEYSLPECLYSGRVLAYDENLDLALLYIAYEIDEYGYEIPDNYIGVEKASELKLPFVDFGDTAPMLGDDISFLGFPAGLGTLTFTQGKISSFIPIAEGIIGAYVTDAIINPGNSGGPAYNEDERVVGIVSAVTTNQIGGNYGLIISSDQIILWFMDLVKEGILNDEFVKEIFNNDAIENITGTQIFNDVDINNKNAEAISYLKTNDIVGGYADGFFKPDNNLNRAELIKILVAGQGVDPDGSIYKDCFKDIKEEWYAKYICYAKEQNWVQGYSNGKFKPSSNVNKAETLKMLFESYGLYTYDALEKPFNDVELSAWFSKYVYTAKTELVLEETDNMYEPGKAITRAQASENLYRILGLKEKRNFLTAIDESICGMLATYKKDKNISISELDLLTTKTYLKNGIDISNDALISELEGKYVEEAAYTREKAFGECGTEKEVEELMQIILPEKK